MKEHSTTIEMNPSQNSKEKLSFENTEIAFRSKSDKDLSRALWLFKMVSRPWMVNAGEKVLNIALALNLPIAWAMKPTVFRHFCGGETIEEAARATQFMDEFNIGTILDYSVEGKEEEIHFESATTQILETLDIAKGNPHIPFCVFKLSGLASNVLLERVNDRSTLLSDQDKMALKRLKGRIGRICDKAYQVNKPVLVDAEESWMQDIIDRETMKMMEIYNKDKVIVFNTIQLYRHDRLEYLKKCHKDAREKGFTYAVKLVRGAYMEKERDRADELGYASPIQPDKESTDRDFNEALKYCVNHHDSIHFVAGTHNEESSMLLADLMDQHKIPHHQKSIYSAQLFGMSDHISFNLSNAGYNVAKYVPYGPLKEVMPYLIRRAQENTSVKGQTGRELSLIKKEIKRRSL